MIQTIRVQTVKGPDLLGESVFEESRSHHAKGLIKIKTNRVFRLEGITKPEAKKMAEILFAEEVNQNYTINQPIYSSSEIQSTMSRSSRLANARSNNIPFIVEIAYKPGVMNPEVGSIFKVAKDLKISLTAADSSTEYAFYGKLSKDEVESLVIKLKLYNPMVEHVVVSPPQTLVISGTLGPTSIIPLRKMTNDELVALSKNGLYLSLDEMLAIKKHFQKEERDPTDCELEILAQTWSEHCVHKTFKAHLIIDGKRKPPLFKRIKSTAKNSDKRILSAFVDNSGVIDFAHGFGICGKVETHNSPSAIEPYGGAMTGSGGVFRDVLGTGLGAKPLISTDIFCFAPLDTPKKELPPGTLTPDYIMKKVVAGVRDYGNRVGIPTNNGSLHFHKDFRAKPTVAVGCFGIIPKKSAKKREPHVGDFVLTIGGRTGRDGIHGATFSSAEMTSSTKETSGSAVQIGNAIEEKRVIDLVLTLRDKGLIHAITDCGAGGFSSAIGELGQHTGAKVYLERVPLKYANLAPWEMFLSESQERMILAIDPKKLKEVLSLAQTYNVEATVIGEFTNTKQLQVYYKDQTICELGMEFMHEGLPKKTLVGKTKKVTIKEELPESPVHFKDTWKAVLSHGDVCSKECIVRMYDHTVQGTTALHPFAGVHYDSPNDGSIVTPLYGKGVGLGVSHGLNPSLMQIDPYLGSVWAITEAVSNFVSFGGDLSKAALIDNFIWPYPDAESLADLDTSVDACLEMARLLKMPFVSGKDSLSSTYRYPDGKLLKIPPVLLISVFGVIPDVRKTVSSDFKKSGSALVLVGVPDVKHLGGSVYFQVSGKTSKHIPHVDIKMLPKVLTALTKAIQEGLILSCHDVSEGGIAAALSEMCFGGDRGVTINLKTITSTRPDFAFFNETAGTFLIEVEDLQSTAKIFKNIPHAVIGQTVDTTDISVFFGEKLVTKASLTELKKSWQEPMQKYFS